MTKLSLFRKQLHMLPELSGKETQTRNFIIQHLRTLGVTDIRTLENDTSFLVVIKGKQAGRTVLFRCELDALPIQETNTFGHISKIDNVSHKCGHDGHMTILTGLAEHLLNNIPDKGTVLLLYQSAEETGQGAVNVLESDLLTPFKPDYVFALHNIPGISSGSIICRENNFTTAVESMVITLNGRTSHAAEPQNGVNPAGCVADLIRYFNALHHPEKNSGKYFISTPVYIRMGEKAMGISAGKAELAYTFRTFENQSLTKAKKDITAHVFQIASAHKGLEISCDWVEAFQANVNDPDAFNIIKKAASLCNYEFIHKKDPFDWGEDFGVFTTRYKGAMFGIGAGTRCPALHAPDYDFPDRITLKGIRMLKQIALIVLS